MPENKLNDEKVLRMFVDRLIADKGGDTLDAKQKETLQKELFEELDERIQQAMIRALPDAKLMELEKLLDEDAPDEEIESFFKNAGADFDPAIRKALDEFRADYFKDKIKVSVKTSILEAAPVIPAVTSSAPAAPVAAVIPGAPTASTTSATAAAPTTPAAATTPIAPVAASVAPANSVTPTVGQPTQGVSSATPGQSNVEGVANVMSAAEQGQIPAVQPQVVTQGANAVPVVTPVPTVAPAPVAPVTSVPVAPTVVATPTAPVAPVTPVAEQPLQAAPNLMDALSAATENLNAVTENIGTAVDAGANAGAVTNTDTTGKEA